MKKRLLLLFLSTKVLGQTDIRTFPIFPSSIPYSYGQSAEIIQTADNGYLLNYGYAYPNWDAAPPMESTLIKTDQNFTPLWSKKLPGGNGKKTFLLNNGASLFFCNSGNGLVLLKVDTNGNTIFSKSTFTAYPTKIKIEDAIQVGNIFKMIGSKNTYNGFGYIINTVPIIIDFDEDGNVVSTQTFTDNLSASLTPTNIIKDSFGNYYFTGNYRLPGNSANEYFLCKMSSANTILWSKRFKHTNDYSQFSINSILPLSNGDVLLGGNFYNYNTSSGGPFLYKLDTNGNSISTKTLSSSFGSFYNLKQTSAGDIIGTGWIRGQDNYNRTFIMKLNPDESFAWAKSYSEGFGISTPLIKSDNEWYFTAFHNNYVDNNNPILFSTNNTGVTDCSYTDLSFDFSAVALQFSAISLSVTSSPALDTPDAYPTSSPENQEYNDGCMALSLSEHNDTQTIVFPNPSSGIINILSDSMISTVIVQNSLGQKVNEYACNSLETIIHFQNHGVYFLTINTSNGIKKTKIIISK